MAEVLRRFLGRPRRFDWVECNCFTFCADWVLEVTGRDPAAQWRGRFSSKADAVRLLRLAGGTRALAERAMASAGAPLTDNPQAGDVVLVLAPIGTGAGNKIIRRPTGAICVDAEKVALMTGDLGLLIAPLPIVKAWSVGCG